MLIDTKVIIDLLESKLNETKLDFYNEYTFSESLIARRTLRKIIELIKNLD